ncbi:DnaJ domain protein [Indivirus ILV1]|uniref:DnaJ domain protein n=1 Tax=Indivirus ILV1 TaxID=1977633 RepID=A0A1V0SCM6_9VIRU|nr:DnaJ domain protein [Indivirus ILV1]
MSTVNLYDVLDVQQDCDTKEIKNAYRNLVKKFHPDKPDGDAEMFELVTHAYNILVNPKTRKEYDEIYALSKQVDNSHFDLKNKASTYYKAMENEFKKESNKKTQDESKINFKKAFEEMDRKHGYTRDSSAEDKISQKDTTRKLRDLELTREQDDIENIKDDLFEGGMFDLAKFNAAFDALHKGHDELIQHSGNPSAWNVVDGFGGNFGSIDNYESLYRDEEEYGSGQYSSVKLDPTKKKKLTKDEFNKLSSADYTKKHNYKDKEYLKSLDEKIRERDIETKRLDDRDMKDYDNDPTCGGYGIFSGLGINNANTIQWDDDEDIKTRYNRLLEMRKNDKP